MTKALWLLGLLGAGDVTPPRQVAVQWQALSDGVIARCGLQQLNQKLLVRLIEEGHAIVDSSVAHDIGVELSSDDSALVITARRDEAVLLKSFPLAPQCDSTLQLQIIYEVALLVSALREHAPQAPPSLPPTVSAAAEAPTGREVWLGSGVFVPGTLAAAPYARVDLRWYLSDNIALQGGLESSLLKAGALLVWEPASSLQLVANVHTLAAAQVRVGATSALLQHHAFFAGAHTYHWDARLGAYAAVGFGIWEAYLSTTVRLVPTRHVTETEEIYRVAPFGVLAGLSAKLFEP